MTRGVWIAAVALPVVLGLTSTQPRLSAQEASWRPSPKPTAPASVATHPGVTLGKPVPITRASSAGLEPPPRQLPPAYRNGGPLPLTRPFDRESPSSVQAIATVAPPGAIIAASGQTVPPLSPLPPTPVQELDEGMLGDQWAVDYTDGRQHSSRPGDDLKQAGNWLPPNPKTMLPGPIAPEPLDPPDPPEASVGWPGESAVPERPAPRFYVRGEYLLWAIKDDHAPPLVTTGDFGFASFVPGNVSLPGALNRGDTVVLFGGDVTNNPFQGGRFTAGMYLNDCGSKAIEVGGFFLGQRQADFAVSSAQVPFLGRPFFAANPGPAPDFPREFLEVVAAPGTQVGSVRINAPSRLYGLNADLVCKLCCGCDYRVNAFGGARYLNLQESLSITEDNVLIRPAANFPAGTRFIVNDTFSTRNQFYGADVGVNGRCQFGRFDLDGFARIALGSTRQTVDISGSQTVIQPGGRTSNFVGGLLALPSNIGSFSRDRFSVVPELGFTLGYNVTDQVRLSVGYNFLYWSSVVRPGGQINRNLDILQIPNFTAPPSPPFGPTLPTTPVRQPQFKFEDTDFWAHGLTVGVEIRF